MKVTTIEKAQNIPKMKVDELLGSLMTFKLSLDNRPDKKQKGIALKNFSKELQTDLEGKSDSEIHESLALLTKQFNQIVKRFDSRLGSQFFFNYRDDKNKRRF